MLTWAHWECELPCQNMLEHSRWKKKQAHIQMGLLILIRFTVVLIKKKITKMKSTLALYEIAFFKEQ